MNESARTEKARLRAQLGEQARKFPVAGRVEDSARICDRLKAQPVWRETRSIFFFAPLPEEPNIWPLLTEALHLGKTVALPRYSKSGDLYLPCRGSDVDRDLQPGYFGIREPSSACPPCDLERLELTLVPGVGFGHNGGRLGRGKGYYDRLLAMIAGWKCGIAFDWQVVPHVPVEPHDVRMDYLVTPTCWHELRCRADPEP